MIRQTIVALFAVVASLAFDAASTSAVPPASDFSARVDNPWFPLEPGTRYVSVGAKDGEPARDVMTVTHKTHTIAGAPCVVVDDRLYLRGRLAERTTDWYSQDSHGNVWYFGEDTAELDKSGRVTNTSGTWQAGVNGARPGIFMPAHPKVGQSFQREFAKARRRTTSRSWLLSALRRTRSSRTNGHRSSQGRSTARSTCAASAPSSS